MIILWTFVVLLTVIALGARSSLGSAGRWIGLGLAALLAVAYAYAWYSYSAG